MNNREVLINLKSYAIKLGHSPNQREVPELVTECYKNFGSFNKAKIKAGLKIANVRILKFPQKAFIFDKDLAEIISYLTFDGHLYKSLKGFMYTSKNISDLKRFEDLVKKKFNLPARYHLYSAGVKDTAHKIYFFNKKICEFLYNSGAPKGDKVIQEFDVPRWIVNSKEFSRVYLKIAFFCEGSFKEESGRTPRILFGLAKSEEFLDRGIRFMNQLRDMLKKFDIQSKECFITGRTIRKRDKKVTRSMRFRIEIKHNNKFIREIGWIK